MKNLKVKDILEVTNGKLISGNMEYECENFSKDTRIINKGDIYIGIKGENFDGSLFWKEALDNGAEGVIIENIEITDNEKNTYKNKIIIIVENVLEALYKIAEAKRNLYNIPVIAVTGSVGKTSTKDIVANVVSQKYKTLKTIGNNNNNIGLPFTLLRLKDEEAAVLEMGMNHFGEISLLSKIAKPDICVITNIGTSHIGNLGSRENILKAKLEILEGAKNPTIVLNNDNDLLHNWYLENNQEYNIKTFGIRNQSDYNAENIELFSSQSSYTCKLNEENININVPVGGEHFILNSLCATAVGSTLGIEAEEIKNGIESFELTNKRMDITELENGIKIINDAYNASYESMKASLKVLSEYKENRKIAVLGDMFELGDFSKELHEKVGEEVIKNNIDILICTGENARFIVKKAKERMNSKDIYYVDTKDKIEDLIKEKAENGDVILFKASNGMKFYELAERMINLWKK